MKKFFFTSLAIGTLGLSSSCQQAPKSTPTEVAATRLATPATATQDNLLGQVVENSYVCMVNDQYMGAVQMEVPFEGKMYYGCCAMCVERIPNDEAVRAAIDPHSGKKVDKASAYIVVIHKNGAVAYFENEANYWAFVAEGKKA